MHVCVCVCAHVCVAQPQSTWVQQAPLPALLYTDAAVDSAGVCVCVCVFVSVHAHMYTREDRQGLAVCVCVCGGDQGLSEEGHSQHS